MVSSDGLRHPRFQDHQRPAAAHLNLRQDACQSTIVRAPLWHKSLYHLLPLLPQQMAPPLHKGLRLQQHVPRHNRPLLPLLPHPMTPPFRKGLRPHQHVPYHDRPLPPCRPPRPHRSTCLTPSFCLKMTTTFVPVSNVSPTLTGRANNAPTPSAPPLSGSFPSTPPYHHQATSWTTSLRFAVLLFPRS